MPYFSYSGFDNAGARVEGSIEADTLAHATEKLRQQGYLIKQCQPESTSDGGFVLFDKGIGLQDVEFLTSELSVLLDAGLKIDKGLELLRETNKKPALGKVLDQLCKSLRSGKQLSQALTQFPDVFDPLYINLVSIGEATGRLAEIFRSLAEDLAYRRDLQQKVLQALTYPAVIMLVCLGSILFIFNYVVPNMSSLFAGQDDLPAYTQMLLSTSDWLREYQWWLALGLVLFAVFLSRIWHQPAVKSVWQKSQMSLPLVKNAVILIERIRFNSGLAMMLQAGVAIDQALQLSCGSIKNVHISQEIIIAIEKIKRGEGLTTTLRRSSLYPDFFASLLAVGEESGELGRIFNEIAARSRREFDQWVTRFTSLLEPLLILVMGGIVGSVVVIMMLSITNVTDVGI